MTPNSKVRAAKGTENKLQVLEEVVAEGSSTGLSAHHQEQIVTRGKEVQNTKDLRNAKHRLGGPHGS